MTRTTPPFQFGLFGPRWLRLLGIVLPQNRLRLARQDNSLEREERQEVTDVLGVGVSSDGRHSAALLQLHAVSGDELVPAEERAEDLFPFLGSPLGRRDHVTRRLEV